MSDLIRLSLLSDWPDHLRRMFPWITLTDLEDFDDLRRGDRLVDDEGEPTAQLIDWVARVIARRGGKAAMTVPVPVPLEPLAGAARLLSEDAA